MSKFIAMGVLGAAAVLLTATLAGCSEGPVPTPTTVPTPSAGNDPVPTVAAQADGTQAPSVAPTDTAVAPTLNPSPTASATPDHRSLTIDEYLSLCAQRVSEQADRLTYGILYTAISKEAERFGALIPPAVLSEWHTLEMDVNRTILELLDSQPKGATIDLAIMAWIATEVKPLEEKRNIAAYQLPDDIRQRAMEIDCIRESAVIVTPFYGPATEIQPETGDHGDDIEAATALVVGARVGGVLEDERDRDYFRFKRVFKKSTEIP